MNPIPKYIVDQYNRAKRNGWLKMFRDSADKYGFTTEDVMGVSSRESNMQNIKGDFRDGIYNGFSLMQLDIHSHRKWIESGKWQDVASAIDRGCMALAEKREQIIKASKQKQVSIKFRSGKTAKFTPKPFNGAQLRQMTLAAYNCGLAAYYHFSIGNSVDAGTTGKDYSKDVLAKSLDFRDLLAKEAYGSVVVPREAEAASVSVKQALAAEPLPNADMIDATPDDFAVVQGVYNKHGELVKSDSAKAIAVKASVKAGGALATIWSTTAGKVALVLTCVAVTGIVVYTVCKYRVRIKAFLKGAKNWILK
jgi:uncharacterized protein (DUF697 family)